MNRLIRCLNTPTVSSWYNYSNFLSHFAAPVVDDRFLINDRRFRYYINEKCIFNSKHGIRSPSSRLLCNNQHQQRRRLDSKKSATKNILDTRPIGVSVIGDQAVQCSSSHGFNELLLFASMGKEVEKYPEGKPSWEKLQHICIRLADTWPLFFLRRMDYTIFRDDVILEDRIYGRYLRGIPNYMKHLGAIAVIGRIMYPQIEMHVLNITPIIEDATVRMRWRVYYMNVVDFFFMLAQFQKFTPEYLKTKGRMVDGYSIYYADSNGAVYRHVIDKVIPDEEKGLAKGRLSLTQRLLALVGGSSVPKPAAPS